ncbi:MAG TPA: hypothetical protein PK400_05580 [Phycisphaerales bacterium]|nr:hypothetical protein [Phycisphaerales bacterium]HRQ75971.1 hypothetical protein [Phycisphaerales bacterium]
MQCNIDNRGRRVRFAAGVIAIAAAAFVLIFASGDWWAWVVAAGLVLGGAFSIFEARKGWCAMRAMGLRTPW